MKKLLSVFLALAMLLCALPAVAETSYTATVDSQIGGVDAVTVTVTLNDDGSIKAVVVDECKDTPSIAELPCKQLPEQMVALNTLNVDTVAGATLTSNRIMNAVAQCLESAAQ